MQFRDNLEMPGGNTRRQTKVEVGLGYCSYRRQVLKLVREMVFKGEHGRNDVHGYQMNLLQGDNHFKRSFHDKVYIVSMGMNTKVQGRLPLLQCITFHSPLVFRQ